jgi:hypothetical protein
MRHRERMLPDVELVAVLGHVVRSVAPVMAAELTVLASGRQNPGLGSEQNVGLLATAMACLIVDAPLLRRFSFVPDYGHSD